MGFSGWEFFKTDAALSVELDSAFPIVASSSIYFNHGTFNGATNEAIHGCPVDGGSLAQGFTAGKFQQLMKPSGAFAGAGNVLGGFVFMQDRRNLTASGEAYLAAIATPAANGNVSAIRLIKMHSGIQNHASFTTLATYDLSSVSLGDTLALEVEWALDQARLSGIRMIVRQGLTTDFSDLTEVIHFLDYSGAYACAVTEGIFLQLPQGADGHHVADSTALYSG